MKHTTKLAASALILAMTLAACGGGGGNDDAPAPTAPGSSSSTPSSSSSSAATSTSSSSSSATTSSSSSSAPAATITEWGFSNDAYAAAGQTLFAADYNATADNSVKLISSDITTGAVTVDRLHFNTTAANVLRYRAAGSSSNATTQNVWNTNGSFYSSNAALIPDVGADGSAPASGSKLRAYIGVPVTAKKAATLVIEYRQTSTTATAGKLALFCSDNNVLVKQDVFAAANADGTYNTLSYSADAAHTCTELRIIYGREGTTSGGVNIGKITLTQ